MNPSTEDIVNAVQQVSARTVFVLPNNSNIIMAAQQAKDLVDKEVIVIPSKTIPQGMSALLAFQDQADTGKNTDAMLKAIAGVQSGQVTYAVRDSQIDGLDIKQGDYLGIHNNKIVTSTPNLGQTCQALLDSMTSEGGEIITILAGEDAETDTTNELVDWLGQEYPNAEVEVHHGGQPLYYYIFAVE
jgi:dihydroxyacetone kinase-like predicted kinase